MLSDQLPSITNGGSGMKTNLNMGNSLGRYQSFSRLSGDINLDYDDAVASLPIGAASSLGLLTRL
jgi:hypothetical protein